MIQTLGIMTTPTHARNFMAVSLLLLAFGNVGAGEVSAPRGPSLIGIDHIPTVVEDLEKDGSGIELISPPGQPTDHRLTSRSTLLIRIRPLQ